MPLTLSISTRLQHQHEALSELIRGLTEQQLKQRINPDKWSAFEHIAHLAAYQPAFIGRLERITTEDHPSFERYVAENDPLFAAYTARPLKELLQLIPDNAAKITRLAASFDDIHLLRTALHPKYGTLSIPQWTQFYLLHEAHHLFSIFMLTQDLRTALV